MPIMQQLPFTIRCQNCHWTLSESGDAIDLPYACPRCSQTELKYEANKNPNASGLLLPKNNNTSSFIHYLKKLFNLKKL